MLGDPARQPSSTHRVSEWEEEELQLLHDVMGIHCKVILDLTHADILLQLLVHILSALAGQSLPVLHSHVSHHGVLQDKMCLTKLKVKPVF